MNGLLYAVFCAAIALMLAVPASSEVNAWFAPSTRKVLRDAKPSKAPKRWELSSARNEGEACQLVLLAEGPVKNVRVSASALHHSRGKGQLTPVLNKVAYVPITKDKIPYPEPLPPITPPGPGAKSNPACVGIGKDPQRCSTRVV